MIIGITGRIGAGKETLIQFLVDQGFEYIVTSKILSEELEDRGLPITRENQQNLGDEWREKYGPGALMKMLLKKTDKGKNYIFDSLRNEKEAEFLRSNVKEFALIAVDAPQKIRFERILKRGKPSDPKNWKEFLKVDNRDFFDENNPLGQQVGKCMELADYKIINDGDLKTFMNEIKNIWQEIKRKFDK